MLFRSMDHLGAAIGPLIAASYLWMWPDGLRSLFAWALLPSIVVVVLVLLGVREPAPEVSSTRATFHFSLRPFDSSFRRFLLALGLFTLGNSSDAFLLVRVKELGVSTAELPLLWFGIHVVKSSGSWLICGWIDRWGPRRFIVVGWAVY